MGLIRVFYQQGHIDQPPFSNRPDKGVDIKSETHAVGTRLIVYILDRDGMFGSVWYGIEGHFLYT